MRLRIRVLLHDTKTLPPNKEEEAERRVGWVER
jgi:hypothetical protein